jgi:Tol biopolymer transport system component
MRDSGLFAGSLDDVRSYHLGGAVTGVAWTASRDTLVAVAVDTTGVSSLYRIDLARGGASLIVGHLDGVTIMPSSIAVTPDGRRAFVALAGANAPVDADRHRPSAARRLSIYEIDLSNGRMRVVANAEPGADLLAPAIANGRLYWTRAETRASVVTLPARGGPVHTLVTDAALPSWRPDGKEIGFYYGDWRVVDWAINWDAGVIPAGARGVATGPRSSLITNFGEDFEPEWSPRGKWIAYHSHHSPGPVPYYGASGSSDDIWLRRIGAPPRDTADIRLTDFGSETGPPSWSRDGTRLIFVSYDRRGVPGQSLLWLVTIDTVTGKPLGHSRVPLPPGVQSISWAAWSPVKDVIAIEAEGERGNHTIWLMSPDSAHARQLVRFPMRTFGGLAWTPNGKTLVYSALVGKYDQLFAVNVAGGKPRRLTRAAAQILHPSVSPNGLVIAATRLEHRKSIVSAPLPLAVKTSAEARARARRRTTR